MANRIAGLSIEIAGETTKLNKALAGTNKEIKDTQSQLRDVERLLKLDPKNTELLAQKQRLLAKEVNDTKDKLKQLKEAEKQVQQQVKEGKTSQAQYEALQREIIDTEQQLKNLENQAKESNDTISKVGDGWGAKIGAGVGKAVAGIAAATVAAGAVVGKFLVDATMSAGQLEQNLGGAEAVFGSFSDKVKETAADAAQSMGATQSDYLATANIMGSLFQGSGFDVQESMELTTETMQRAADVASVMGIDTSAAMESIAGAAKGNFTMMDNLGVAMNDTTLNAYAMEKGIDKTTQQMTNQEKIGLAMQMFLEKTAKYEGNFAKESKTMAGSLGILTAEFTNFKDNVGTEILQPATEGVQMLSGALSNIGDAFREGGLAGMAGQIGEELGGIVTYIAEQIPQLIEIGNQIIQSLLKGLTTNAGIFSSAAVDIITSLFEGIVQNLPLLFDAAIQIVTGLSSSLGQQLPTLIPMAIEAILAIVDGLISNIGLLVDGAIALVVGLADGIINALPMLIDRLPELIIGIINGIVNNLPKLWEASLKIIVTLASGLIKAIPQLVSKLPQIIFAIVDGLASYSNKIFEIGGNIVKGIWEGISGGFTWIKNKISGWVGNVLDFIKKLFGINSPSKVLADEVGKFLPPGIAVGFDLAMPKTTKGILKDIDALKSDIYGEFSGSYSGFSMQSIVSGGRAQVTPLTGSAAPTAVSAAGVGGGASITIEEFNNYDTNTDMPRLMRMIDEGLQRRALQKTRAGI